MYGFLAFISLPFVSLQLGNSVFAAEAPTEATSIRVSITTHLGDGQRFQAGDEISLLVSLNQDAYLLLVYQDADGNLVKLFPVRKNDTGWVKAGDFMPFPRREDGLRLVVSPPFGEEQIWAFAAAEVFSKKPLKNSNDIETLRKRLQRSDISFNAAYTRLITHGGQP